MTQYKTLSWGIPAYGRYSSRSQQAQESFFYIERIEAQTARTGEDNHAHTHPYLYQLSWVSSGDGSYDIEFSTWPLQAGHFYLLAPGVVHACHGKAKVCGYVIHFSPTFLLHATKHLPHLTFQLNHLQYQVGLGREDQKAISALFEQALVEFQHHGKNHLVHSYLGLILQLFARQELVTQVSNETGGYDALYTRFVRAIQKETNQQRKLDFYARLLHTTPKQLNRSCQAVNGLSAMAVVRQVILHEAKQLLKFSNQHIVDIAELLGFTSVGYFRKYFRRYIGLSASEFRRKARERNGL